MTDTMTLTGVVATTPRHIVTSAGLAITSFRLASTQRRFDRSSNRWVDGDTNWYTVTSFRQLAFNAATSVDKGDRIVAVGKLRIRDWQAPERSGTTVELEAETIGHDLLWGTTSVTRTIASSPVVSAASAVQAPRSDEGEQPQTEADEQRGGREPGARDDGARGDGDGHDDGGREHDGDRDPRYRQELADGDVPVPF
ncbi:single-stranded DNA-binding protein [Compostimonas suwonensis]|uniref:Single-strand DNA-binding protein n=1 Tax=Compostimonas suwonensis TaxID=1048394 RepID=A0A2M9BZK7_9MICO|nr:single-stranded DNA-binding protein [Compostimonas suwonensis]PJJ63512.1 single-strand DNA-binding protein [Compostimonas suwonensis]